MHSHPPSLSLNSNPRDVTTLSIWTHPFFPVPNYGWLGIVFWKTVNAVCDDKYEGQYKQVLSHYKEAMSEHKKGAPS